MIYPDSKKEETRKTEAYLQAKQRAKERRQKRESEKNQTFDFT